MKTVRGKEISFKKYLQMGADRKSFGETPEHDFACDAGRDKHFRENYADWEELESYLLFHNACPEAVTAARVLYRRWKAGQ